MAAECPYKPLQEATPTVGAVDADKSVAVTAYADDVKKGCTR
jgi:hypothetical protein